MADAVSGTTRDPNKATLLRSLGAEPVVVDVYDPCPRASTATRRQYRVEECEKSGSRVHN